MRQIADFHIHSKYSRACSRDLTLENIGRTCSIKGINIIVTQGHTLGQQHPLVKGKTNSLFFCADLIPSSAHLPYPWHMAYDNYPVTIVSEKKKILKRALKEKWILFFEHDPGIVAATIRQGEKNIEIDEKIDV